MARAPEIKPFKTDQGWRVNIPKSMAADGKRHKKYFRTESEAKRYAGKLRSSYASGVRGSTIPLEVAVQATEALRLLDGTGIGLVEAVKIVVKQMATSGAQETFSQRYDRAVLDGEGRWSKRYRQDMDRLLRWLPSRAHDNGLFLIFSNGVGIDDDEVRTGNAMILYPYGRILAETSAAADAMVVADLDASLLEYATGRLWIRARRPELYGPLTQRTGQERSTREIKFQQ